MSIGEANQRTDAPHRSRPKGDADGLLERQLPQSIEAEQAVLCSLLLLPEAADEVALILKEEDFFGDANRRIYGH
ncbi:MAG: DnaB-like helicase N-terminal domain-containing protein, partial [Planctomycetota bacterium]